MNLPANTTSNPCSWTTPACAAALAAVCLAVYGRLCGYDFVGNDDYLHVYQNPYLSPLSWSGLAYLWRHPYEQLYIPVAYTGFALLCLLSRGPHMERFTDTGSPYNPHVFHTANVILHIVNALFVFFLLRRIVKKDVPALAGGLLFALHPLQVESVAWVSEFRGLLASLFCLASLSAYLKGTRGGYVLGSLLFVLALLCKPSSVCLPPIALALDFLVNRRPWRRYGAELVPWLLGSLALMALTRLVQPGAGAASVALPSRLLVASDALAFYALKTIAPVGLAMDYGRTPAAALASPWIWAEVAGLLAAAGALIGYWRRWTFLSVSGTIWATALLPVLGLAPFAYQYYSTVADRYAYLSLLGPSLAVAMLAGRLPARAFVAVAAALTFVLGALSVRQGAAWQNTRALIDHTLGINPHSPLAHLDRGDAFFLAGRYPEALAEYETVIRERPDLMDGHYNAGTTLCDMGRPDDAVRELRRALEIQPGYALAHMNLGNADVALGRAGDALGQYDLALLLDPGLRKAHFNRGNALMKLGRLDDALAEFDREIALDGLPSALVNKGIVLIQLRRPADAIAPLEAAIASGTPTPAWYTNLALAQAMSGRRNPAVRSIGQALALDPADPTALALRKMLGADLASPSVQR